MNYFVKELADHRAILVAEDGCVLAEFASVENAVINCAEQCGVCPMFIEHHYNYLAKSPLDFESSYLN